MKNLFNKSRSVSTISEEEKFDSPKANNFLEQLRAAINQYATEDMAPSDDKLKRFSELKHFEFIDPTTLNTSPKDTSKEAKHKREQMIQYYEYLDLKHQLENNSKVIFADEYQELITTSAQPEPDNQRPNITLSRGYKYILTPENTHKEIYEEKKKLETLLSDNDSPVKKIKL
ncbi:MAG TPA: hypothetical protein VM577_01005 [Anaerovoracaceae bacterium]|nr:hypothetical protein [Anaerovoracaceae bacterium]